MAKTKVHGEYLDPSVISGQTQVTAVGADSVLILDATDNALKKALLSDVIETVGSTPSFTSVTVSGDLTTTGNINLGDDDKVVFGAGSDLEIYHTATNNHSIIEETGGGNLVVRTNGAHIEFDKGSSEFMARMLTDGAVELYHDGSKKLETTSTGINVGAADANNSALSLTANTGNWVFTNVQSNRNLEISDTDGTGTVLTINTSGNVGIGENVPAAPLHVEHSSGTAFDSNTEVTESTIISNKAGTDNSGVNNYASLGLHVADGATSQGFMSYVRDGNNSGYFAFSGRNGSSSYKENMRITSEGLWTTAGLHIVHSSTPNNFVAGASADTWYDIDNYNYQNQHNGTAGVDGTAMTITLLTWANQTTTYGYIVRLYIIHGAYSANTHTLYGSAGVDSSLDAGDSYSRSFGEKYDVGGNGAIVYATGHTDIQNLKVAVRFNNHTATNYNPLTLQIKTNGPPASGTTPSMKVMRL